ncbi:hypothetical protein GGS24DRAFT_443717 [Hypoxylon argillaceum]|nr:hypothetical protein GGS24DRAFT_443717 [Hypoxylon argillaceum]KAI1153020.1 hypothetical protein F4825DRAFT_416658 [Nemania diffusa]
MPINISLPIRCPKLFPQVGYRYFHMLSLYPFILFTQITTAITLLISSKYSYLKPTPATMEGLLDLFFQMICQVVFSAIATMIERLVLRHRDAIVQTVRRLQATLRIPPCLWMVSETAPGVTYQSLQFGTRLALVFGLLFFCLLGTVAVLGKVKSVWGLLAGVVFPACAVIPVWICFIRARQRFDQGERDILDKGNGDQGLAC